MHTDTEPKVNGSAAPNGRLATNRLAPQRATPAPPSKASVQAGDDVSQNRVAAKKMAEEKARARTLARAQAVAEKLSTATEQVASAIAEANSAVVELEKTMHSIAAGAEEASAAAEESRAAINQIGHQEIPRQSHQTIRPIIGPNAVCGHWLEMINDSRR